MTTPAVRTALCQKRAMSCSSRAGSYLETTAKDPEQHREFIPCSGTLRSRNSDGQAILTLARSLLQERQIRNIPKCIQQQVLTARGRYKLRTRASRTRAVKCANVLGQALRWSQAQRTDWRISVGNPAEGLDLVHYIAEDCGCRFWDHDCCDLGSSGLL
jgi:hypothetical protein